MRNGPVSRGMASLAVLILLLGLTAMATLCCHQLAIADWRWQDALWQSWHGVQEGQARVDFGSLQLWRQLALDNTPPSKINSLAVRVTNQGGYALMQLLDEQGATRTEQTLLWRPLLSRQPLARVMSPAGGLYAAQGVPHWQLLQQQDTWLWDHLFKLPRGEAVLRDLAARVMPDCRTLSAMTSGLLLVTNRCDINQTVGSEQHPVLLLFTGTSLQLGQQTRIFGIVLHAATQATPTGVALTVANGARIEGALISEYPVTLSDVDSLIRANSRVQNAIRANPEFRRLFWARGSWDQE